METIFIIILIGIILIQTAIIFILKDKVHENDLYINSILSENKLLKADKELLILQEKVKEVK